MQVNRRYVVACVLVVCCLSWTTMMFAGDETTVKGFITGRTGDSMTLRGANATNTIVVLNDETKVQEPKGVFRHKGMTMATLVPGLAVEAKGITNAKGQLVAKVIRFKSSDLKTASAIQAGLVPTEAAVQANKKAMEANQQAITGDEQKIATDQAETQKRFTELTEYETKANLVVDDFPVGKATLSEQDKAKLNQIAQQAKGMQGYLIQVKGFCDSSGTPAQNQALSQDRAEAVIAYLQQEQVPLRHILAPGAMSTVDPVASNETASGRAENRRVEVKVLLNKGVADTNGV